ncbi:hypothetical protein ACR77J_07280 [Tissierella praeacuta]
MLIKFYEWITGKCWHEWTLTDFDTGIWIYGKCRKCGITRG